MDYFNLLDGNDVQGLGQYLKTHDVNQELQNQTLLYWATHQNNFPFVKYLVHSGANLNKKDQHNRTPLLIASYFGFYDIVNFLLENNANIDGCIERATNGWDNQPQTEIIKLIEDKLKT